MAGTELKWKKALAIFICLVLSAISCTKEKKAHEIEIIDGIRIVHNIMPEWGNESKIELKFVRKIGGKDTKDENYVFFKPFDLVQDQGGNKYVLSFDDPCIRKFDPDWKYVKRFGKKGQGPGEVSTAIGCDIGEKSNIFVMDYGSMRVQIFDQEGEPKGNIRMLKNSHEGSVQSSGRIILTSRSYHVLGEGIIESENPTMLAIVDSKGEVQKRFVKCRNYDEPGVMYRANSVYFDVDEHDNVYVTFENQNRIERYSPDGELIFMASRPLNYEIDNIAVNDPRYSRPIEELTFVSGDIRIDKKGRLWVTTYQEQPESQGSQGALIEDHNRMKFEIFSNEGILLGEVPVPIAFNRKRIYGDTLYLVDPFFEACIYEYRIIEK